jgi:NhaP-type Na+/H+ or K+/H+ antiporter
MRHRRCVRESLNSISGESLIVLSRAQARQFLGRDALKKNAQRARDLRKVASPLRDGKARREDRFALQQIAGSVRMYQNAAVLAGFALLFSAISGGVARSWVSGPIVFTAAGFILGSDLLGLVDLDVSAEGLRLLAEGALAMVLFTEAANADLDLVRQHLGIPGRLLLVGLPLTIILGFAVAAILFPALGVLEMALVAAMLAPTDAALGKPVVTNPAVPTLLRQSLNIEGGLNDGICVPVILILLELAVGTQVAGFTLAHMIGVVAEEIGLGALVGLAITGGATLLLGAALKKDWASYEWFLVPAPAAAITCFALAQFVGGSGFIACFVGGLLVSWFAPPRKHELLRGAESIGETLALMTWVAFGATVSTVIGGHLALSVLLYSVLSLTLIRMLPVVLCLTGTRMSAPPMRLFIGWFGPRGLASIVFAIIVADAHLPEGETITAVVATTVLLSVVAHGVTANLFVTALGRRLPDVARG